MGLRFMQNSTFQTPPSGFKSTELWSLFAVLAGNLVIIFVITGHLTPEKGDQLTTVVVEIIQITGMIVNLYAWKWYSSLRMDLKEKYLNKSISPVKRKSAKSSSV